MKSKITVCSISLFFLMITSTVFAQTYEWAKSLGSSSNDNVQGMVVDASGNVYTTGSFVDTVDFDPGTGTFNLTSAGFGDIYILKIDSSGNFLWAKGFGSTSFDGGGALALHVSGNLYVTGQFYDIIDFDPGVGTTNLTSAGGADGFILKLNPAGDLIWVKSIGGIDGDSGYEIALDATGNIYTMGKFRGTADLDPSSGGVSNLSSNGGDDVFVMKLDASGNFLWAKGVGGTVNDAGFAFTVDAAGNAYTTGYFRNTVDFDPGTGTANLTSAGIEDFFVQKLDASGNYVWAISVGGTSNDYARGMDVDAFGNVYVTGRFKNTVDFDPGVGVFDITGPGNDDIFILKLDALGNFVWAKAMGGSSGDSGYDIFVGTSGNLYTTGTFRNTADLDPSVADTLNLTSAGITDMYIMKLDTSGGLIWIEQIGGVGAELGDEITTDAMGNIYTVGYFTDTVDFDPGVGTANLMSVGMSDMYVFKMSATQVIGIKQISLEHYGVKVAPNPFSHSTTIEFTNNGKDNVDLIIFDITGKLVRKYLNLSGNKVIVPRENLEAGIYLYQLRGKEDTDTGKLVIN